MAVLQPATLATALSMSAVAVASHPVELAALIPATGIDKTPSVQIRTDFACAIAPADWSAVAPGCDAPTDLTHPDFRQSRALSFERKRTEINRSEATALLDRFSPGSPMGFCCVS